ncbi:DUF459 domain-containing protein [Methylosinus sp. H3A]|uniref:SGNH/GDSL hydrolase family protein n=1 Tax=Methylosinus sp. H3A TaxID=2785786 RepID=UPI0018C2BC8C|nr:SGNH family hydrolase [Methylosinus sp. H3A]MBG0811379.1 DUF459 domain-containing protein [Methylosinus sp. H3A]
MRSLPRFFGLFAILLFALLIGGAESAHAQDPVADFFQGLFGGRPHARPQAHPPARETGRMRRLVPHREYGAPAYWHGQSKAAKKDKTQKPEDPNAPPPFQVAVIGDSLGQMLADGLEEAYSDRSDIRILHKAKDSTGLVREDYFDWPKAARELLAGGDKIDMAVIMIGSNDRQAIHEGSETIETLSPRWRERYAQRVESVRAAFREKKIPLVWVGLPVTKSEHFAADMAKFNDIYRQAAVQDSAPFIDIWEAFADERNQYQAFGPDINGRIVKLRSADGVHFTDVGARKLAHFVEGDIKRLFDTRHPAPDSAPAEASQPPAEEPAAGAAAVAPPVQIIAPSGPTPATAPTLPDRPAIGPLQSLTTTVAADGELARRGKSPSSAGEEARAAAARALVDHIFVEGGEQPSQPGRADDFSWPKGRAKPAETPAPAPAAAAAASSAAEAR